MRVAVVGEAARFFGVPTALLLEFTEAARVVRVVAAEGHGKPSTDVHPVADLPVLEDFVASRAPARRSTPTRPPRSPPASLPVPNQARAS